MDRVDLGKQVTQAAAGRLAGMDDLLDALHALRPLWLPSLVLSLAAGAGLALIAWS